MKRQIVNIDRDKCNGCGLCIPNCHEGALQVIDGKAILVSDMMCDGLGACLGHCPEDAISIEEREAEPYDEIKVIREIVPLGKNVLTAHLKHLHDHNEKEFLMQGVQYLRQHENELQFALEEVISVVHGKQTVEPVHHHHSGCPGSREQVFQKNQQTANDDQPETESGLQQWPIQLHLINPASSVFSNADLLLTADCVAYAKGNFHREFMRGKSIAIACPKLDSGRESYIEKISAMITGSNLNTITVLMMEVPCCGGLLQIARQAVEISGRKIPVKAVIIGIHGDIISEQWV